MHHTALFARYALVPPVSTVHKGLLTVVLTVVLTVS